MMNKKGVFQGLQALAVGVAGLAISLVVAFIIMAQAKAQIVTIEGITNTSNTTSLTAAYNATSTLQTAASTIPSWVSIVIIAVIGALLIGLVAGFMGRRK